MFTVFYTLAAVMIMIGTTLAWVVFYRPVRKRIEHEHIIQEFNRSVSQWEHDQCQ